MTLSRGSQSAADFAVGSASFRPTEQAAANLQASGVVGGVHVTGNTVIDAAADGCISAELPGAWVGLGVSAGDLGHGASPRELGEPLQSIADGFLRVLDSHPDTALLLPLHKNPTVREPLQQLLGSHHGCSSLSRSITTAWWRRSAAPPCCSPTPVACRRRLLAGQAGAGAAPHHRAA